MLPARSVVGEPLVTASIVPWPGPFGLSFAAAFTTAKPTPMATTIATGRIAFLIFFPPWSIRKDDPKPRPALRRGLADRPSSGVRPRPVAARPDNAKTAN